MIVYALLIIGACVTTILHDTREACEAALARVTKATEAEAMCVRSVVTMTLPDPLRGRAP